MKILIHSNAPWVPSGYGSQVMLMLPRLRALGHEVAVSSFYGLSGSARSDGRTTRSSPPAGSTTALTSWRSTPWCTART